jgi:phage protein D
MSSGISVKVNGTPDDELTQAITIEVHEKMGEPATFALKYELDISGGDLPYLTDSRFDPGAEIVVTSDRDGTTECLVKGPVHAQNIHMEHGAAGSWLEVKGSDTSITMDRESRSAIWKDLTDSDAVQSIVSKYGYTPDIETTAAGHFENKHTLVQRESDLSFIRRLARRNGFIFWITCDPSGQETAHFKRPPLGGSPAAGLVINLDSPSVETLDISWDIERPTQVNGVQLDLHTKSDLNLTVTATPQTLLGQAGQGSITGDIRSVHLSAPADDAGDLTSRGEGALIESDWFLRARCKTTMEHAGKPIRANSVIEISGAGSRFSGKYFVSGVKHIIDASAHKMEIELLRNAWGA